LQVQLPSVLWKAKDAVEIVIVVSLVVGQEAEFELTWRIADEIEFYSEFTVNQYRRFKKITGATHDTVAQQRSRDSRLAFGGPEDGTSLTYGEISFLPFSRILELAKVLPGEPQPHCSALLTPTPTL